MQTSWKKWLKFLAAGSVVLVATGCETGQKTPAHQKQVSAANERWHNLRSTMMLQLAQQQFDTGDLDQAEKTLSEAIAIDPKNASLHVLAGRIGLERGQLERGFQRLSTAVDLNPKLPEAYYYQGIVLQRWQKFDDAKAAYSKAYELQADNPTYLLSVSEMLATTDKVDEAIELLSSKLTYFDQNAAIRAGLGQLYTIQGKHDKAAEMFQQACVLKPDDLQLLEAMANAQISAGQLKDGVRTLEKVAADKSNAERKDLQLTLAGAYEKAGRAADAKAIYVKLTKADPSDSSPWLKLGHLAWSQKDDAGALLAAKRAISLAPQNADAYLLAGLVFQKRNNVDDALRNFDRASELAPDNIDAVIMRGVTLQRAGRQAAAAEAYAEALKRAPNDPRARSLMASVSEADRP